jgi:DNA-directed RNA polymerase specialized sigma24 family protein
MKQQGEHISGAQLVATFEAQDWNVLWPKLQAHAVTILQGRYGVYKAHRVKELSQIFVQELLEKVVSEGRKWYPDSNPEFYDFLTSALESHINNYWKKEKGNVTSPTDDDRILEVNSPLQSSIDDDIATKETRESIIALLRDMGADDDEELVFGCMADGIMVPREIQKKLGISAAETNTILRRLRRRLDKLRTKLFGR